MQADEVLPPEVVCEVLTITEERKGVDCELAKIYVSGVHRREVAGHIKRAYELHFDLVDELRSLAEFLESGGFDATSARALIERATRN